MAPSDVVSAARQSIGAANEIAHRLPSPLGHELAMVAHRAFVHAADHGLIAAAAITLIGMIIAVRILRVVSVPPRRRRPSTRPLRP